ncbi:hypothetical protein N658DRAFT_274429 [Parathielavia hyrcaniae]|uniref:Uncharacterized protein n=1 Tax=Parathielavia hyrcaniae TaxID=113614 RepID=A0AAN6Q800_9PEZI|nr:hypothetical protein N658DRAFT_274429 [Parathielavia hyrcaniae]
MQVLSHCFGQTHLPHGLDHILKSSLLEAQSPLSVVAINLISFAATTLTPHDPHTLNSLCTTPAISPTSRKTDLQSTFMQRPSPSGGLSGSGRCMPLRTRIAPRTYFTCFVDHMASSPTSSPMASLSRSAHFHVDIGQRTTYEEIPRRPARWTAVKEDGEALAGVKFH